MKLTEKKKAEIDAMSMTDLLIKIRFSDAGHPLFQGESGEYALKRYARLRNADPEEHTRISKKIGWVK